ncbi:hypothetical protein GCM10027287_46980 [Bordetella muralis]
MFHVKHEGKLQRVASFWAFMEYGGVFHVKHWGGVVTDMGEQVLLAVRRGGGEGGASRGRSAAFASDIASSTSSLRSFGFPRSTTRRPSLTTTPPLLAESWIAA